MKRSPALKRLERRVERGRRDLRMVATVLTGGHPEPLIRRSPTRAVWRAGRSVATAPARSVQVVQVVSETADAVSLWLERVDGGAISFQAGQFLVVEVIVDGAPLRRAYSISSASADRRRVRITVKRTPGGRVSSYLNDAVRVGHRFVVQGPSGRFTPRSGEDGRHLLMIGAGSGITPLRCMAATVLETEPRSRVSLVYGNRRQEQIIFAAELAALCEGYPGRLTVRHVLGEPSAVLPDARIGVLDAATLEAELDGVLDGDGPRPVAWLCGPPAVMVAARQVLLARGWPEPQIHEERFASRPRRRGQPLGSSKPQVVTVLLAESERRVEVRPGQTILAAARDAAVPLDSSCAMGGCGACKVRLRNGVVDLGEPNCLSPEERERGDILPCVAHPRGPVTLEAGR